MEKRDASSIFSDSKELAQALVRIYERAETSDKYWLAESAESLVCMHKEIKDLEQQIKNMEEKMANVYTVVEMSIQDLINK